MTVCMTCAMHVYGFEYAIVMSHHSSCQAHTLTDRTKSTKLQVTVSHIQITKKTATTN